jgi:hypothetical protein
VVTLLDIAASLRRARIINQAHNGIEAIEQKSGIDICGAVNLRFQLQSEEGEKTGEHSWLEDGVDVPALHDHIEYRLSKYSRCSVIFPSFHLETAVKVTSNARWLGCISPDEVSNGPVFNDNFCARADAC